MLPLKGIVKSEGMVWIVEKGEEEGRERKEKEKEKEERKGKTSPHFLYPQFSSC